jgi:hypothetical protein
MGCVSCGSEKQMEFGAEMNIHFPGRDGCDKPAVWSFPQLLVCLDCGVVLCKIPEAELLQLEGGVPAQEDIRWLFSGNRTRGYRLAGHPLQLALV